MSYNHSNFIEIFLNDESVGAGNFIRKIHEYMDEQQRSASLLQVDNPIDEKIQSYSLQDIISLSNQYAAHYYAMGICSKDPVILFFDDNIHYFLQFVALTKIGAVPVFINSLIDVDIFTLFVMKVKARYLVSTAERIQKVEAGFSSQDYNITSVDIDSITVDLMAENSNAIPLNYKHGDNDVVLIAHTSGTTDIPKAVQFTHEALCFGIKQEVQKLPITQVLSILPHSHGAALSILMSSLLRGATIRIQTQKEMRNILHTIENYKPDFIASFPKVFVDLGREDLEQFDLSSVKYWLSTGDANHEPHIRTLIQHGHHVEKDRKVAGSCFIDNLGSSESAFAVFSNVHTINTNNYNRYVGAPFAWIDVAVLAETGEQLPPNQVGLLGIKSRSVTKGYWNDSYLTEKNTLTGYWLTGDLVYKNEEGIFFHVDRTTDAIVTHQGNMYSCQSEEWLLSHMPELFDVSIIGAQSTDRTEVLAMVEMQADEQAFDEGKLKNQINTIFSEKGWPLISKVIEQPAHESVGVTGKKLKRKLRDKYIQEVV